MKTIYTRRHKRTDNVSICRNEHRDSVYHYPNMQMSLISLEIPKYQRKFNLGKILMITELQKFFLNNYKSLLE